MEFLYNSTVYALVVILLTVLVQNWVAAYARHKFSDLPPGKMDASLGHESFVFRSHRTFMNALENVPLMVLTVILAMVVLVPPFLLAVVTWVYALARIGHMFLYYTIATNKNPSPRSYLFLLGFLAQLFLLLYIPFYMAF